MKKAVAFLFLLLASRLTGTQSDREWRGYGRDARSTKYSPLDQIDASNVSRLRIEWR
jgi:quinoprotein glucose dehydrogenase